MTKKSAKTKPALYKVLVCRVGEEPKVEEVENPFTFTAQSVLGGGYVEVVHLDDGVEVYCDEDGLSKNLPHNCNLPATAAHLNIDPSFIIEARGEDDPPFAKPGELGYHRIHGNFTLTRHDYDKDEPVSLTDEDVRKYIALVTAR